MMNSLSLKPLPDELFDGRCTDLMVLSDGNQTILGTIHGGVVEHWPFPSEADFQFWEEDDKPRSGPSTGKRTSTTIYGCELPLALVFEEAPHGQNPPE